MKKRIISLLLVLLFAATLIPGMATGAAAAQQLSASPYAAIEYQYSPTVQTGTIRYVAQLTMSPYFREAYWGSYVSAAGHECLTASISMALSYIGVSATPGELGDYWSRKGYQGGTPFTTVQWDTDGFGGIYSACSLEVAMQRYMAGGGNYSPAIIHLTSYSANGHWVVVAGKVNANTYLIVDPASDQPWELSVRDGRVFYQRNGAERSEPLEDVFQYVGSGLTAVHRTGTFCPSGGYADVPDESNWAHLGIDFCIDEGLMQGTDGSHFQPSALMTRAMLVTVLYRAAGAPDMSQVQTPFTDLNADWYRSAVAWAYTTGVTSGLSQTIFDPDASVTREQLVAMLYRFSAQQNGGVSRADLSVLNDYQDDGSVSDWAKTAFCWAVDSGIVNGVSDTQLQPQGNADRAQIATILMRYSEA